jgi:hypothetical protein
MSENELGVVVVCLIVSVVAFIWTLVYLIGRQRGPDKPSWAAAVIGAVAGAGITTAVTMYVTFNALNRAGVEAGVGTLLAFLGDLVFGCGLGGSIGALIGVRWWPLQQPVQPTTPMPPIPPMPNVPDNLVWAIIVTVLGACSWYALPFGIVSIVYAAQVNEKLQKGDYEGAVRASHSAKTWAWVCFGCIILVLLVSVALRVILAHRHQL